MADKIDVTAEIKARDAASSTIERVNRSLDQVRRTSGRIGSSLVGTFGPRGAFGGLGGVLGNFGSALGNLRGAVLGILGPMSALVGLAGGAALGLGITNYVDDSEKLRQMAGVIGLNVRELSAWLRVAEQSNVSGEQLSGAFEKLNTNARAAAMGGNKELAELFKRMGISLDGVRDGTETGIDLLPQLADAFGRQRNAATVAAMSNALFGRRMDEVAQMLRMGRGELEQMLETERAATHVTDESVRAAQAFRDSQEAVGRMVRQVRDDVGVALMPAIVELTQGFRDWFAEARPEIVRAISESLRELAQFVQNIDWASVRDGAASFFRGLREGIEFIGGFKTVAITLGAVLAGPLLAAVTQLGFAFGKLAFLVFSNPWTAIIMGIATAALLIYTHWDEIAEFFTALWARVKEAFEVAKGWVESFLLFFVPQPIIDNWAMLSGFFTGLWGGIRDTFMSAVEWMRPIIAMAEKLGGMVSSVIPSGDSIRGALGMGGGGEPAPDGDPQPGWWARQRAALGLGGSAALNAPGAAPTANVEGQVRTVIEVRGLPPGSTASSTASGIAAPPDVGLSMATP